GLPPVVVQQVFELLKRIRAGGLTVLIVEQNVQQVLRVVDRAYLLKAGSIRTAGGPAELLARQTLRAASLGVGDRPPALTWPSSTSTCSRRSSTASCWAASSPSSRSASTSSSASSTSSGSAMPS